MLLRLVTLPRLAALVGAVLLRGRIIDAIEAVLQACTGQRRKAALNSFLRGNFAPVRCERGPEECKVVEGALPEALDGVFLRIGPDPVVEPTGDYHWFDGDGLLHAMRLKGGAQPRAIYSNRYVATPRVTLEQEAKRPLFTKVGDMVGPMGVLRVLLGLARFGVRDRGLKPGISSTVANTAIELHPASGLLALNEGAAPFAMRLREDGVPYTVGQATWGGALTGPQSAHPKFCPRTGELWTFGYATNRETEGWQRALVRVAVVDAKGVVAKTVPIHGVTQAVMMHDCALTDDHFVLMDHPLLFDPKLMMEKGPGFPIQFEPSRASRYGLLPRDATNDSKMQWFELASHMVFHTLCAWEEGDQTLIYACVAPSAALEDAMKKVADPQQKYAEFYQDPATRPQLCVVRLDRATGEAAVEPVLDKNYIVDFPRAHPSHMGRPMRHGFVTRFREKGGLLIRGCVKVDLYQHKAVGEVTFGEDEHGGEMLFVPREEDPTKATADDSGFLMCFTHNEATAQDYLVIYDAASMELACRIAVPHRTPYGFHAGFVHASQFDAVNVARAATYGRADSVGSATAK